MKTKTIRLLIELTYDEHSAYVNDYEGRKWFASILTDPSSLLLHSNEIGDEIGSVKVLNPETVIIKCLE